MGLFDFVTGGGSKKARPKRLKQKAQLLDAARGGLCVSSGIHLVEGRSQRSQ